MFLTNCAGDDLVNALGEGNTGSRITISVSDGNTAAYSANTRATYAELETTFEPGDAIGVYAYEGDQCKVRNVKFTLQDDGTWKPETDLFYSPACIYYAYYPYNDTPYEPVAETTMEADAKFANFISDADNKFWRKNQETKADFDASNLLIATGVPATSDDNSSVNISFPMLHKRGLVVGVIVSSLRIDSDTTFTAMRAIGEGDAVFYADEHTAKWINRDLIATSMSNMNYWSSYYLVKPGGSVKVGSTNYTPDMGKYILALHQVKKPYTFNYATSADLGKTWTGYSAERPSWLNFNTESISLIRLLIQSTKTTDLALGKGQVRNVAADAKLKAAKQVTAVDLSLVDNAGKRRTDGRTTANCYLVHAAGSYRLPLVYGNAITAGATNEKAYKTDATGTNILQNFVNHKGEAITAPWIKDNGITIDGAKVVWQDVKGLISNVGIADHFLTFSIDKSHIAAGNAVVAATSNGQIVWSWHIWVTDRTLNTNTAVQATGNGSDTYIYNVAPVNIGQVDGSIAIGTAYAGSLCKLRITDSNGLQYQAQAPIRQPDYVDVTATACINPSPYYQWGRKDALWPATSAYDSNGNGIEFKLVEQAVGIGTGISNPTSLYFVQNGANTFYSNLWDLTPKTNTDSYRATVKTVYDPCPPDYCVPTAGLYTYLTQQGSWQWSSANTSWSNGNGALWQNGTLSLFFPATGYWDQSASSQARLYNNCAEAWSATAYNSNQAYGLEANSQNNTFNKTNYSTFHARPVRPILNTNN